MLRANASSVQRASDILPNRKDDSKYQGTYVLIRFPRNDSSDISKNNEGQARARVREDGAETPVHQFALYKQPAIKWHRDTRNVIWPQQRGRN